MELQDVDRPVPKDDEVQVKIHAASINSWDWELTQGVAQITFGGRKRPPYRILGCDISGTVEAVGGEATLFKPGDPVFGDLSGSGFGGFAEYTCAKETVLARKSASLKEGQRVLVNGAGGGVGTFAVQIAKTAGAEVTGVDRGDKADTMLSIGADHVVDYEKEDFTKRGEVYDLILDVTSRRTVFDYKRALARKGVCIILGGKGRNILGSVLLGSWIIGSRKVKLLILRRSITDLEYVKGLYEAGKVKPVIDRTYPLGEVAEAFRYFGEGGVKGKIVIRVLE
jgi:NADPH:quinone reductase-like Zn-dependent oxidoreductase